MASLQFRSGSWRVIFRHKGLQHFVTIGEVDETEAQGVKARYEYLLRLLKQRLLTIPAGMDIVTFLRHDAKPPDSAPDHGASEITFAQLRDGYLKTIGNGAVEKNTLYTSKIHLAHLAGTLGEHFLIASLAHADLQRHVTQRSSLGRCRGHYDQEGAGYAPLGMELGKAHGIRAERFPRCRAGLPEGRGEAALHDLAGNRTPYRRRR